MKKIFTIICLLISLSLSASHVHRSLTGVANGAHFYYCITTVDTVFVSKPSGGGITDWNNGGGYITADSIPITNTSQGYWTCQYGPTSIIEFYVNFVSISPTTPWTATSVMKCPGVTTVLAGQTNPQPDFTYVWSPGGATSPQIYPVNPGTYSVTVTGACATVTDQIQVNNYPVPVPNLGPDVVSCFGNTVMLNPGLFAGYVWSTGVSTPTIPVITDGIYSVTITDTNGCHNSDTINVHFTTNAGELIELVTIDTVSGNNKVTWGTTGQSSNVITIVYREVSTNTYAQVGTSFYSTGEFIDAVNSTNQTWRYKISTIDTCGNESAKSPYHQTISTATVPLIPSGYRVEWTAYLIEGGKSQMVSNYYVFGVDGLGVNWLPVQIATVSGSVTSYNLPTITDSMFVVGAQLGAKSITNTLALSNVISNPLISSIPSIPSRKQIPIYPNPSAGTFTVSGNGTLLIYNYLGEHISTENIYGTAVMSITPGIYLVKIIGKDNVIFNQKVIIQ